MAKSEISFSDFSIVRAGPSTAARYKLQDKRLPLSSDTSRVNNPGGNPPPAPSPHRDPPWDPPPSWTEMSGAPEPY